VTAALAAAKTGDGLFVMADTVAASVVGRPQSASRTNVTTAQWASIASLNLAVYVEFPSVLPPVALLGGAEATASIEGTTQSSDAASLPVQQSLWERAVAVRGDIGPATAKMDLLHPHKHVVCCCWPA